MTEKKLCKTQLVGIGKADVLGFSPSSDLKHMLQTLRIMPSRQKLGLFLLNKLFHLQRLRLSPSSDLMHMLQTLEFLYFKLHFSCKLYTIMQLTNRAHLKMESLVGY